MGDYFIFVYIGFFVWCFAAYLHRKGEYTAAMTIAVLVVMFNIPNYMTLYDSIKYVISNIDRLKNGDIAIYIIFATPLLALYLLSLFLFRKRT